MKAIRTKYFGPTNTKGARFQADDGDGNRVTVSYDYDLNSGANHEVAALALCTKMKWAPTDSVGFYKNCGYHTWKSGGWKQTPVLSEAERDAILEPFDEET